MNKQASQPQQAEVNPLEDLMREHGVLRRVLLIYEACITRSEHAVLPVQELKRAVAVIQTFIESYHEKLEEDYIFPIFEHKNEHVELVATLRTQHERGRVLSAQIQQLLEHAKAQALDKTIEREIAKLLRAFIRMYRPHAAREDTVLFPRLHELISAKEVEELGDTFEDIEHERFGEKGFETIVQTIAEIERKLGIYELAQFTP